MITVPIKYKTAGYYLRWYFNGWHYWYFTPGSVNQLTSGQNYATIGKQTIAMYAGQVSLSDIGGLRGLLLSRDVFIYTSNGWASIRVNPGSQIVYNSEIDGYEMEIVCTGYFNSNIINTYVPNPPFPLKPLLDLDENVYTTVIIGNLECVVENLKVTKYVDGSTIPNVTDNGLWAANTAGAMCYYDNDEATYKATYGGLYNWPAVNNEKGLARLERGGINQNFRVFTDPDFTALLNSLGGDTIASGKMKEAGLVHWTTPNTGATNESGFTGLPGGFRTNNGAFTSEGLNAYFRSSTAFSDTSSWNIGLAYNSIVASHGGQLNAAGHSIRLVRDV